MPHHATGHSPRYSRFLPACITSETAKFEWTNKYENPFTTLKHMIASNYHVYTLDSLKLRNIPKLHKMPPHMYHDSPKLLNIPIPLKMPPPHDKLLLSANVAET